MKKTNIMINVISDEMPIYEFNLLKHSIIVEIDRNKKARSFSQMTKPMKRKKL